MKKPIIILIVAIVVSFILILTIVGISTGIILNIALKEKTSMSASDFYSTMSQKGYSVHSANDQPSLKQEYIATNRGNTYEIKFYEFLDASYATSFYNNIESTFAVSKSFASAEKSKSLINSSKYSLSSNGKYMVVSRIDNTVIYINVDDTYRDTIKSLLEELGY